MKLFLAFLLLIATATSYSQNNPESHSLEDKSSQNENLVEPQSNQSHLNEVKEPKPFGGNMFLGYGVLSGNISDYASNPVLLGFNFELPRRNLVIQFDNLIGFGGVRNTMVFPDELEWEKGQGAMHFILGSSFGYKVFESKGLKIVPLAGIGVDFFSSGLFSTSEAKKHEAALPYYKMGCYFDLKNLRIFANNKEMNGGENYNCIRLSMGYQLGMGTPKYSEFYAGNMLYFTIGWSGFEVD